MIFTEEETYAKQYEMTSRFLKKRKIKISVQLRVENNPLKDVHNVVD